MVNWGEQENRKGEGEGKGKSRYIYSCSGVHGIKGDGNVQRVLLHALL